MESWAKRLGKTGQGWHLVAFGFAIILTIAVFHPVLTESYWSWWNNHYNYHGFFIPLISLCLIYSVRGALRQVNGGRCWYGVVLCALSIIIYGWNGRSIHELLVASASMVIFLHGMILLFFGKRVWRILLFPISFLVFMAPIPDFFFKMLIHPLQLMTAIIGEIGLRLVGIAVLRSGINLYLSSFAVVIDESCSSLHSLITLTTFSLALAYLNQGAMLKKAVIVGSAIPLAIIGNGVRLVAMTGLAVWAGQWVFHNYLHPLSGKIMFVIEFGILLLEIEALDRIFGGEKEGLSKLGPRNTQWKRLIPGLKSQA